MDLETLKKEIEKHGPEYLNNFIENSKPGGSSANDKTSNDDDSQPETANKPPNKRNQNTRKRIRQILVDDSSLIHNVSPATLSHDQYKSTDSQ